MLCYGFGLAVCGVPITRLLFVFVLTNIPCMISECMGRGSG